MSTDVQADSLSVVVDPEGGQATLCIPAGMPRRLLTQAACSIALSAAQVQLNARVEAALTALVQAPPPEGDDHSVVVATAVPPCHGADGRVEWFIDAAGPDQHEGKIDYYQQTSFVFVTPGQRLGRLVPPTPGEDGCDVRGKVLPATPGKSAPLALHDSILQQADGTLLAQQEGLLIRLPGSARISKRLEIAGHVDFSTGNIDFPGDVVVGKSIKDLFKVRAAGTLEVHDVIEAAEIHVSGDLIAHRGMAGRQRGSVEVGGDFHARYLDNVQGVIEKKLIVASETINCDLTIYGNVDSPQAALIGGRLTVVGKADLGAVGSEAGAATQLILGSVPRLEARADELRRIVDRMTELRNKAEEERTLLEKSSRRMTADHKERHTELSFEIQRLGSNLAKALTCQQALMQEIERARTVDLTVRQCIHAESILVVRGVHHRFMQSVQGPLRVTWSNDQAVCGSGGGEPVPLTRLARRVAG
jgi:hypothetical protein